MTKRNSTCNNPGNQPKKGGVRAKYDTPTFINLAVKTHGQIYDYSKTRYTNSRNKVIITCLLHGDFEQAPASHLYGAGCPDCGRVKTNTANTKSHEDYIKECLDRFGTRYNYSKTKYKDCYSEVVITCKKHGDFTMPPYRHLAGAGCSTCATDIKRSTKSEFIEKAIKVHGKRKYKFHKVEYVNSVTAVEIYCEHCKLFFHKTPNSLLSGSGCPNCYKKTTADFIRDARATHGNKYLYDKSEYKSSKSSIVITCRLHGDFRQLAGNHLRGKGCKICSRLLVGFSRTKFKEVCKKHNNGFGSLYVIKCYENNSDKVFYKIGITSKTLRARFFNEAALPYKYDKVFLIEGEGGFIYDIEKRLHAILSKNKYEPETYFKGSTECFTTIKPIEKLVKELQNTEQLQLLA